MKRWRRSTSVLLLILLAVVPTVQAATQGQAPPDDLQELPPAEPVVSPPEDLEEFRGYVLDFVHQLDEALQRAAAHPVVAERAAYVPGSEELIQIPLPNDVYEAFKNADDEQLMHLRDAFARFPELGNAPRALDEALAQIPALELTGDKQATCGDNYAEWQDVVSFGTTNKAIKQQRNILAITTGILATVAEAVCTCLYDVPYVGCRPVIPLFVIRGILGAVVVVLTAASDILGDEIAFAELCLASCLTDDGDVHGEPTKYWRGRGCDNRDNNCAGGIDDDAEDLFNPEVTIDAAIVGRCFPDTDTAVSAVRDAVHATDDCSTPRVSVTLDDVSTTTCQATFSAMAFDAAGNATYLDDPEYQRVVIDGAAPVFMTTPTLEACYPDVSSAREALTGSELSIADCSAVDLDVTAFEKECVADFELTATDACGNRAQRRDRARIDGKAPSVDIQRLLIPSYEGLSCFDTQADALAAVAEATTISDRCTAPENLITDVTASGLECNLLVTASATDECGNASSDSLTVRVDALPPKVTCSVANPILYPADDKFVDVGFSYTATDICQPDGPEVTVEVTSDEPTALAYSVIPGDDPFPDAIVTTDADGTVSAIELRAQRSQNADGRVYRLRVTATDACGKQSYADCFVTVPRSQPGPGSAINSGQDFDATAQN